MQRTHRKDKLGTPVSWYSEMGEDKYLGKQDKRQRSGKAKYPGNYAEYPENAPFVPH